MSVYFGGTFDPPTLAHVAAASAVSNLLMQPVVWLPNARSPLKSESPSAPHRLAMLRLLCDADPRFSVDTLEINRPPPSYAVETLEQLKDRNPDQELIWMMGADSFEQIQCWDRWPRLLELANLIVLNRPGYGIASPSAWRNRECVASEVADRQGVWCQIEIPPMDVAASHVRQAIEDNQAWEQWVPQSITEYIKDNHLYVKNHG